MPTIQTNGTQLHYIEQGQGEPVVLVHGTLGDYRSWELQMDVFAQRYRTISYSRRYHHPNECSGEETDYSAALHAEDLAGFLTGLGLDSAHVVGNSYGAYTALLLAANHPKRVRTLVLGEPPVLSLLDDNPEGRREREGFLSKVWEPTGDLLQRGETKDGVRRFVDGVVEDGAFDGFPPQTQSLIMDNACELKVETSSPDFWTPFTHDDARRVTMSTLLLTGDETLKMLRLIVDELDSSLPNNRYVIVPDSTHEMPADNPLAYNEIVLGFLTRHSG
jgi:pimeloyl-ACP methyl ester carboxylesterase